mgnify:CR=1 FL=1
MVFEYQMIASSLDNIFLIVHANASNIQFFDLEKMLLCSAYRAVEKVSLEEFEEDEIVLIFFC